MNERKERVAAIVTAGGRGERMGGGVPKQFRELWNGRWMLECTLDAFRGCAAVDDVWVTYPGGCEDYVRALRGCFLVEGGATNQESIWNALRRMAYDDGDLVVVHDGDRPLVDGALIGRVVDAARECGAALCGLVSTDYVMVGDGAGIRGNLPIGDRRKVVRTHTPQACRMGVLRAAYAWAANAGYGAVGPCDVLSEMGVEMALVPSTAMNGLKVTTAEEMEMAGVLYGAARGFGY